MEWKPQIIRVLALVGLVALVSFWPSQVQSVYASDYCTIGASADAFLYSDPGNSLGNNSNTQGWIGNYSFSNCVNDLGQVYAWQVGWGACHLYGGEYTIITWHYHWYDGNVTQHDGDVVQQYDCHDLDEILGT